MGPPAVCEVIPNWTEAETCNIVFSSHTRAVGAAAYLAPDQTRNRLQVTLVADGIARDGAASIRLTAKTDFDAPLAQALKRHGEMARIGVATHGADIVGSVRPA